MCFDFAPVKVLDLARHMFKLFALSLDLPEDYFDDMTTHPGGIVRLLYYPACTHDKSLEQSSSEQIGLGAHSDCTYVPRANQHQRTIPDISDISL